MAEIILFEHINFHGAHKHLFTSEPNLNATDDHFFNDAVSSFVVVSGQWQFSRDWYNNGPDSHVFGPGLYSWVENVGIPNDSVSSVALIHA
jgi:Beta/Gamma crystallin